MSMPETVYSKNGVPIRLTDERWAHITEEHGELMGLRPEIVETVANPRAIFAGNQGELLAPREVEPGKYLVVGFWWSSTASPQRAVLSSRRFSHGRHIHYVEGNNYGRSSDCRVSAFAAVSQTD